MKDKDLLKLIIPLSAPLLVCGFYGVSVSIKNEEQNKKAEYKPTVVNKNIKINNGKNLDDSKVVNDEPIIYEVIGENIISYEEVMIITYENKQTVKTKSERNFVYGDEETEVKPYLMTEESGAPTYKDFHKRIITYYFSSLDDAYDYIENNGDTSLSYKVIDSNYEDYFWLSDYDGDGIWMAGRVGEDDVLTLDQIRKGVPFPEKDDNYHGVGEACTIEEFVEMYSFDFDDEAEAEDWYDEWGCEPK